MNIKKVTDAMAAVACLGASFTVFPAAPTAKADAAVVIDTSTTYQTIRGFGGINLPEWAGSDLTSAQVQKAFGNGPDELGLTILRIYVSDDSNAWGTAVPTALAAQKMGATVFASPWNPPTSMRETFTRNGVGNQRRLKKSSYGDYAKHLNNYVKFMESKGVNLYSISIQNEPDYGSEWTWWTADECVDFLANYGSQVTAGTKAKLMSPETFQYNKEYYNKILNNSKANSVVDLFGTHFYGTQRSQMDFPALENSGKDIWMTEVYVPNSDQDSADRWPEALQVSENIHNGLVVGNMNAYVWWFIRRHYSPMKENGNISKRGYCMAQYSKFVRPGDVRISATEQPESNIYVSAYKNSGDKVTVVAVNKGTTQTVENFTLKKGETIENVDRYRTSANENLAVTESMDFSGSGFYASLPAQSVSTFVIDLAGNGSSTQQPATEPATQKPTSAPVTADADGYFFHDTFENGLGDWEARGSVDTEKTNNAYSGSGAAMVSGRTSAWNGIQKSLDTSTFVPGNSYSFSVNALASTAETFMLSLQYVDASGETNYSHIATAQSEAGQWVQLANKSYKIPSGASDLHLYVETEDSTSDFSIDEAIVAKDGTSISGAQPVKLIIGDVTCDGVVNAFDMAALRSGLVSGEFSSTTAKKAADVDENGTVEIADAIQLESFLLHKISAFTKAEKPAPSIDSSKWDNYKETASSQYIDFYKSSIKNFGNTHRLVNKLAAAEQGESLTVAYLGGSITEGKNYTSPFSSYIKDTFAKGSFKEVNAGLSGTSSVVGLVRSEQEIVSQNPDIIFLEFSVNDHEDILYKKCFESCVKKFLSLPNDPAVIILITRAKGGFSSQSQMAPIGTNYDIPVISMDDALTKAFNSGFLSAGDYYTDEYHPHQKGGQLFADCMSYYVRQAMKSEHYSDSYTIPTKTVYGTEYETCVNMTPSQLQNFNLGSWKQGSGYNGNKALSYSLTAGSGAPLTFSTTGKGLIVVFKANSSGMGSVDVTVNGKTTKINGNKQYTWGGPDAELGYYQNTSGQLDVSISGSNFTIWGLGVVK